MTQPNIPDARIIEIARRHTQYESDGKLVTLRGAGILEFARELLAEPDRMIAEELREKSEAA